MVDDRTIATVALAMVTLSLPLYLHGVWVILRSELVTWSVLVTHLRSILPAIALTGLPVLAWMLPRAVTGGFSGLVALHIFLALQAYALLLIGLWGIVPIYRAKRRHHLYRDPDPDVDLAALDERMPHWRRRLRVGVFGHLAMWLLAYLVGVAIYVEAYAPL